MSGTFDTPTLNHHSALSGTSVHYVWDLWYSYSEPSQCLVWNQQALCVGPLILLHRTITVPCPEPACTICGTFDTPILNHHSALSGTSMHYVWDLWYSYTEPSQCLVWNQRALFVGPLILLH